MMAIETADVDIGFRVYLVSPLMQVTRSEDSCLNFFTLLLQENVICEDVPTFWKMDLDYVKCRCENSSFSLFLL